MLGGSGIVLNPPKKEIMTKDFNEETLEERRAGAVVNGGGRAVGGGNGEVSLLFIVRLLSLFLFLFSSY